MDNGLITCGTCHVTQLTNRITKPQQLIQRKHKHMHANS